MLANSLCTIPEVGHIDFGKGFSSAGEGHMWCAGAKTQMDFRT